MTIARLAFLAVEDHDFQRRMLVRILTGLGAERVSVAANGSEALEIAMKPGAGIDIIISDLDMPGMDGLELMRHLGKAGLTARIILVSALGELLLSSAETMSKDYGVSVLGLIEKPVTPAKLEVLIRRHLGEHPAIVPPLNVPPLSVNERVKGLGRSVNRWLRMPRRTLPIDRALLAAIAPGDRATQDTILREFRQASAQDTALLVLAVERRDSAQVTQACERIAGAGRTVGARGLASECARLARAGCAGDWDALQANMSRVRRELDRIDAYCDSAP